MANQRIDVQIDGGMGFFQFNLLTKRAIAWKKRHVCTESWNGGNDRTFYCDDTRMAQDIAQGMLDAGLAVR